ncbi:PREDICTED: ATP synthase subunit gamma, mitochondrial-like isoform X1 [Priapulus caudatus]|uniref:ATP synthase subunit gamma n=1 Tax=Priapulus caudatus TaxID=37621 RepID=A0ABM1EH34_PRICU|nr:PREDICTED: ATP synthase subunit gamma, mitochondrial-like isoform X1 [Priapulus caudatus]
MFCKAVVFSPQCTQVRGMVTLKDISMRIKSVGNIQKITKSMKMVSAAKFSRAERELRPARPYGVGAKAFYDKAEIKSEGEMPKHLIIAISSDRGLCGAIHNGIGRAIKSEIAGAASGIETKLVLVGDKCRAILQKDYTKNFLLTLNNYGKKPPTFNDAALVSQAVLNSGYEFDIGDIYFNRFRSIVSYKIAKQPMFSLDTITASPNVSVYDSLDGEVLRSYQEFSLASLLFYGMKENSTSEQSSRMTAMDSATKNAGEMIDKLKMTYNRTRQAVITRELVEIISGAAALE